VGCYGSTIYALDIDTGKLRWDWHLGGTLKASPALVDDVVYMCYPGVSKSKLCALDADTGDFKWTKTSLWGQPTTTPVVDGDRIYIGTTGGTHCLDALTGDLLWVRTVGAAVRYNVVGDGLVFVGGEDNALHVFDGQTGELVWEIPKEQSMEMSAPVVTQGMACFMTPEGVYSLDTRTRAVKWSLESAGSSSCTPAVSGGTIYVGSMGGEVYALDARDGSVIWSYKVRGSVALSPAVAGGVVYVASGGNLYALNALDGTLRWKIGGYDIGCPPSVGGGMVVVGTKGDFIFAFHI
jgi:outer membrane protein assembly factor BamB